MEATKKVKIVEVEGFSPSWKRIHIVLLLCAAVFGLAGGVPLAALFESINFLCRIPKVTNTSLPVPGKYNFTVGNFSLNLDVTLGSSEDTACDFVVFTLITSFIFGIIWMVFFIVCGPGGRAVEGMPQPWRIVLPALIFCTLAFIIVLAASIKLAMIINKFCTYYASEMSFYRANDFCLSLPQFHVYESPYIAMSDLIALAKAMSWLCTVSWGISAAILLARIITGADFRKVLVTSMEVAEPRYLDGDSYQILLNSGESSLTSPMNAPKTGKEDEKLIKGTTVVTIEKTGVSPIDTQEYEKYGAIPKSKSYKKQSQVPRITRKSPPVDLDAIGQESSLRKRSGGGTLQKEVDRMLEKSRKNSSAEKAMELRLKILKKKNDADIDVEANVEFVNESTQQETAHATQKLEMKPKEEKIEIERREELEVEPTVTKNLVERKDEGHGKIEAKTKKHRQLTKSIKTVEQSDVETQTDEEE